MVVNIIHPRFCQQLAVRDRGGGRKGAERKISLKEEIFHELLSCKLGEAAKLFQIYTPIIHFLAFGIHYKTDASTNLSTL